MRKLLLNYLIFAGLCFTGLNINAQIQQNKSLLLKVWQQGDSKITELPRSVKKTVNTDLYLKTLKQAEISQFAPSNMNFRLTEGVKNQVTIKSATGTQFFGNIISSSAWSNLSSWEIPYGIYSFKSSTNPEFNPEFEFIGLECNSGVYTQGKYLAIHPISFFGVLNGVQYYLINTDTWQIEKTIAKEISTYEYLPSCLTFDATTNTIYALRYNSDLTGLTWATMNEDFEFTDLNNWDANLSMLALVTLPSGVIYGIGEDGNLYTLDKSDGTLSLVGNTGVTPAFYNQSASYDGKSGKIVWAAVTTSGTGLYEVDPTTGTTALISRFANDEQIVGLYTIEECALDDAPAKIADLTLEYTTPGDLSGTITCTSPSKTFGGNNLTGVISLTTKIDGKIVDKQDVSPGAHYSFPFSVTNNNHTFSITTSNSTGISPIALLNAYVGYDYPVSVSNLLFNVADSLGIITWDAPTTGINNGYVNPDSLFYNVIRYPDQVIVAKHLTLLRIKDTLPNSLNNYSYGVIPFNGYNKAGVADTSNMVLYGDAYNVPFTSNFTTENDIAFYKIIDGNNDNVKWFYINGWMAYWSYNAAGKGKDWFVSPPIKMEQGRLYQLTFSYKSLYSPFVENMKVALGTSNSDTSSFSNILFDQAGINVYDFTDTTIDVMVNETKNYYIGFYAYSDPSTGTGLYLKDFSIKLVGNATAPEGVTGLTIVPDANDDLKATISFTAPGKNLAGGSLTSLTDIKVYRGNNMELVTTMSNPTPFSQVSCTDVNIPETGITTYTVIAYNESGAGRSISDSAFIGIYPVPYEEHFNSEASLNTFTLISSNIGANDIKYNNGAVESSNWMDSVNNWIISPPVKFDDETIYKLSYNYYTFGYKNFKITMGRNNTPESQTVLYEMPKRAAYSFTPDSCIFTVHDGGKYFMGMNLTSGGSDFWSFSVTVDDLVITRVASAKAPGTITNLEIIAGENGEQTASVSFKAPELAYGNSPLESITKIDVYRNKETTPLKTFNAPAIGSQLSFTDQVGADGTVNYTFVAENTYGKGKELKKSVFIGMDIPDGINDFNIKATANNLDAILTWKKPVGINNGFIDYNKISYNVYKYNNQTETFESLASDIRNETYSYTGSDTDKMIVNYLAVTVSYNNQQYSPVINYVVLGKPYNLPFGESFENMSLSTTPWVVDQEEYSYWAPVGTNSLNIEPQDQDGGQLVFVNQSIDKKGSITMPKIILNNNESVKNEFSFWLYKSSGLFSGYSYALAEISVNDEAFLPITDTLRLNDGEGWTKYSVSLDGYKNSNFIKLQLRAYSAYYSDVIFFDNILVKNIYHNDLSALGINVPENMDVNQNNPVTVQISNQGMLNASGYSVDLYCNNLLVETKTGTDVETLSTSEVVFNFVPKAPQAGDTLKINAVIRYTSDEDISNNTSNTINTLVNTPVYPAITNLTGELTDNKVALSWSQPEKLSIMAEDQDGYEDYQPFMVSNIGDWTMVDGDKQTTVAVTGLEFDNMGVVGSYMVWNQDQAGGSAYDVLAGHSGSQCLISWASSGYLENSSTPEESAYNNDWLISPKIVGGTRISFWAGQISTDYGFEKFEVLYSYGSDDTASFKLIKKIELSSLEWQNFDFVLPVNANYFAIRNITISGFALKLDDFEYTPVDGKEIQLTIAGYNLYRNNIKLNESLIGGTEYIDNLNNNGSYTYSASVVYDLGESKGSNKITVDLTSVIHTVESDFNVFGLKNTIVIKSTEKARIKIYNILGSCIYNVESQGFRQYYAEPGTYIVKWNSGNTRKVIVY
jgi:hypothetical protein